MDGCRLCRIGAVLIVLAAAWFGRGVLAYVLSILLGGVLLGVIEIFAKAYIGTQLSDAVVFAVLIVVLLVKPAGLLGKQIREKV